MKIAIGADHAGFVLKDALRRKLERDGHEVVDFGTNSPESTDYPDYAQAVAGEVSNKKADRGILVCYTGIGMAIAANKVAGVRAAPAQLDDEVRLTRQHNDANVLTLGARFLDEKRASELVDIFLNTEFEGGRHSRRVAKIKQIEDASK
ncbi:MAG TPA: ribose 5-phosphate isomerase B [Bryobacteraceae bacterium]|nr:ribose 5-phosphate isomerase B [Bryobacteraceae bacterium]